MTEGKSMTEGETDARSVGFGEVFGTYIGDIGKGISGREYVQADRRSLRLYMQGMWRHILSKHWGGTRPPVCSLFRAQ